MVPFLMKNPIMPYAWGSRTAIAQLLGQPSPAAEPQAELWMGAHPKAPSRIRYKGREQGLDRAIAEDPPFFLGDDQARRFGGQLPFLMKVLAADQPLSIQAHPDGESARQGFAAEENRGLAPEDPRRCFKDCHHKPELIYAMSPFTALCGFQPITRIAGGLRPLLGGAYDFLLAPLENGGDTSRPALERFFMGLFGLPDEAQNACLSQVHASIAALPQKSTAQRWVVRLMQAYPQDMGALAPLILNFIELSPGQALFLKPRTLHAYLQGVGLEIMANSDNVLRGGLTTKHMDLKGLSDAVEFTAEVPLYVTHRLSVGRKCFQPPVAEFCLESVEVIPERTYDRLQMDGLEILLCIRGEIAIRQSAKAPVLKLQQGQSALLPFALGRYHLQGRGACFIGRLPAAGQETP